nr:MAG TPA: hypothetical protein [Caudoviricetes sp.]
MMMQPSTPLIFFFISLNVYILLQRYKIYSKLDSFKL